MAQAQLIEMLGRKKKEPETKYDLKYEINRVKTELQIILAHKIWYTEEEINAKKQELRELEQKWLDEST